MTVLPKKILEDFEIDAFISRVNSSAEKIISDPKFKLTTPSLPGFSLLLKLQIRAFEKSLASSFAPIFLGKQALSGGFKGINDAFNGIKEIFSNPLQFVLEEGLNSVLGEFPFPIRFEIGGGSSENLNLPDSDARDFSVFRDFSYEGIFSSSDIPSAGQYTTPRSSIASIDEVVINRFTNNGDLNELLLDVGVGDQIQISDGSFLGIYTVNSVEVLGNSENLRIDLTVISVQGLTGEVGSGSTTIPGFGKSSIGLNGCQLAIQSFINPSGSLRFPLKSLGVNIPFLSSLIVVVGDFSKLKDSSPTKKYVGRLSQETGLEFQDVLGGMLTGKFPNLDFKKIQEEVADGVDNSNEQSKEDLVVLARVLEIAATNPCFLIGIIINYLKLLLLPVRVVISVIRGLASLISGPVPLIRTVINGITDPIGLVCDLVSRGFLEVIRPYIQNPIIAVGIPWEEALVDPRDMRRGLQPLISDMVCGEFSKKLKSYTPNQGFFVNLSNSVSSDDPVELGPQITYDLFPDNRIPSGGQISINSLDASEITLFKISSLSNTVENALPYLAYLSPGDVFDFQYLDQSGRYRISSKKLISSGDLPYFEISTTPLPSVLEEARNKSETDLLIDGIDINGFKAKLSIDNPDKEFLFIIEEYLPIKMIAIWESIKGVVALFGGLAQQVPSLIPAILRSLLGLNKEKSNDEILDGIESENSDFSDSSIEASKEILNLLYKPSVEGLVYEATVNTLSFQFSEEARDALSSIIQNSPVSTDPGIETVFYDLADSLKAEGKDSAIFRNKLSTTTGRITKGNVFLNIRIKDQVFVYPERSPSKDDFYWGAYGLRAVGDSVKVMSQVLFELRNTFYFNDERGSNVDLTELNLQVYKNSADGKSRDFIYSGNAYNALNKYKITKGGAFPTEAEPRDIRIKINREMNFLINYGLLSLLKR